jgi:hypothetical protein
MSCKRRCALRSNQPSNAGSTHSRRNQCGRLSQFSKSISTLHFWCPAAGVAPGRRALDEEHALGTFDVAGDRGMPQIGEGGRVLAAELIMPPAFRVFPSRTLNRSPCLVIFYAATHCVSAAARKPTPDRVPDPNLRWRWLTFACTKIILNGFHPSLGSTGIAGIERNARSTVFRKRSCRSCKPTKKPKSSWLTVPKMGSGSPRPTGPIPRRGTRNSIPALSVSTTSAVTQCRRLRTGLPVISMPAGADGLPIGTQLYGNFCRWTCCSSWLRNSNGRVPSGSVQSHRCMSVSRTDPRSGTVVEAHLYLVPRSA